MKKKMRKIGEKMRKNEIIWRKKNDFKPKPPQNPQK
jgi:hypothetical protein